MICYPKNLFLGIALILGLPTVPMAGDPPAAETPESWYRSGQDLIEQRRARFAGLPTARNVILFVGDGMSLATVAAARVLEGQQRGESGEENSLVFERFEHLALAKTYNTNQQTPDSAGTMTAMATGVKSFAGAIAVDQRARRGDCASVAGNELVSLLDLAALAGMGTGIVTTARLTHATPAALYAHSPDRRWESDAGVPPTARAQGCRDIAQQLIAYDTGRGIDIALGGGRRAFLPIQQSDPEYPELMGHRADGRDLTAEWLERRPDGHYVWNREQWLALPDDGGPVLGLFETDHMQYEHDRASDTAGEPSLSEMTAMAVERLSSRPEGFFLMVEGARIDHAHHANNAYRALVDTIELARAVQAAMERVDPSETLIVVTADHGHALTFGGYGRRGNPIMGVAMRPDYEGGGISPLTDPEGRKLTVLGYATGPGYRGGKRPDYDRVDPTQPSFRQESTVEQWSATHTAEDVAIYATGPGAEPLFGVIEQHALFHALVQAAPRLAAIASELEAESGLPVLEDSGTQSPE
ncbi:alkaline phosphatase [Wenzhouxiangella marina]|uniref:Alkaline phosphatase n=1 Tax=Wenzhouxiangella marina TaxID=1579979 RepID=A0A0K0XYW7_9GAMM|nr:alkaline phosphatase [Wenzhouxiangella marina]AKS42822.1 Alkaline phosphatase [Wenzhouxiangella marina]MBB6087499.1 alkaline phosphatase [Wenzhouxiangella marina]